MHVLGQLRRVHGNPHTLTKFQQLYSVRCILEMQTLQHTVLTCIEVGYYGKWLLTCRNMLTSALISSWAWSNLPFFTEAGQHPTNSSLAGQRGSKWDFNSPAHCTRYPPSLSGVGSGEWTAEAPLPSSDRTSTYWECWEGP